MPSFDDIIPCLSILLSLESCFIYMVDTVCGIQEIAIFHINIYLKGKNK